jgi:hypothetical protein
MMTTHHTEVLWTHEVCRPPQRVSESLTVWICQWVEQDSFPQPCKGLEGFFCTYSCAYPLQTGVAVTLKRLSGSADLLQWTGRI